MIRLNGNTYVNPDHVVALIADNPDYTRVLLLSGDHITVNQRAVQVAETIREGQAR